MTETCDVIVIGLGGFGGAAFDHLARRGARVIGLEQFSLAHDRGSSHGETRIIRKAYFEHPDYVPLLLRAYELWRGLEADCGAALLHQCGLVIAGPPAGEAVAGARLARSLHGVPLEDVPPGDAATRFPGFLFPAGFDVVFEPDGGYLHVERCVRAQIERGIRAGGVARFEEPVRKWSCDGAAVSVTTDRGMYSAGAAVIAAGAWAGSVLKDLNLPLEVVRKPLLWCRTRTDFYQNGPCFFYETPQGMFYGFPSLDEGTLKVAEHSGGNPVADPAMVDRSLHEADVAPVARFLAECLPGVEPQPVRHSVCLYTLTPDRHFVVDRHAAFPNVAVAAGFSGHGFKFTPVIGEALADLALRGETDLPIGFLGSGRFGQPGAAPR